MSITREFFGMTKDGESVSRFTLTNGSGAYLRVLSIGCALQAIGMPDRSGKIIDVCAGFDSLEDYESKGGCFGAVVGRHANRMRGGVFTVGDTVYYAAVTERGHIHGGARGFHRRVWRAESEGNVLRLHRVSPDGEEGFPGNLDVTVEYELTEDNRLCIRYRASTDADTVVNLTNHTYFNLNGHTSGSALGHVLRVDADRITTVDADAMSDGGYLAVAGTPYDFNVPKEIGRDLAAAGGYDNNYVLRGSGLREAALLRGDVSGITMRVITDQPGMQLFSAPNTAGRVGKGGFVYEKNAAVCLETQHFPNSPEHPHFPSVILRRGQTFTSETDYCFGIAD